MEFCPPPWPTMTRVVMTSELASAASMGWYRLGDAFPTPSNASAKRYSWVASEHCDGKTQPDRRRPFFGIGARARNDVSPKIPQDYVYTNRTKVQFSSVF
jgi:hypothetical protein